MTVSPNRPQDGNPQPIAGDSGVEPNDRSRVASLPPTLFKLPNLGLSGRNEDQSLSRDYRERDRGGLGSMPDSNRIVPPMDNRVAPAGQIDPPLEFQTPENPEIGETASDEFSKRDTSARQVSAIRGSADSSLSDWDLGSRSRGVPPVPVASVDPISTRNQPNDELTFAGLPDEPSPRMNPNDSSVRGGQSLELGAGSSRRPPLSDMPAGRSWMDSLGSHGVVIALLLVVVAAALLTGRGDEDPNAKSLSTQSELLNFDELNAELPLPAHDSDVMVTDSQPSFNVDSNPPSTPEFAIAAKPETATPATAVPVNEPVLPMTPQSISVNEMLEVSQANPIASLESPVPAPTSSLDQDFNGTVVANGVKTNHFVAPSAGTQTLPVAVRVEPKPADSTLPSLEELARLQSQSVKAAESNTYAPTRLLTKTPVGISDWSQYLPPLNAAVEPNAGTSSSSNQVFQP